MFGGGEENDLRNWMAIKIKQCSMKVLVVISSLFYSVTAFSQNSNFRRDSLYQILKQAQTPAGQVIAWTQISEHYGYTGQPDSSRFANEQIEFKSLAFAEQAKSVRDIWLATNSTRCNY